MDGARIVVDPSSSSSSSSLSSSSSSSSSVRTAVAREGLAARASWRELWTLRRAAPGTPEHRRWSIGLYARLERVARGFYAVAFPRTDRALREQAWSNLWARWCERAPGLARSFDDDDDIARYVNRSLANALYSLLRRRAWRARLLAERAWELEQVVHSGGGVDVDDDPVERDERVAAVARAVRFFASELTPLLSTRRAGRANEVARLARERLAMARGACTFADVVAAETAPGQAARTVENRLRKRYGRALQDIVAAVDDHHGVLVAAGHDPAQLRSFALRLFSDRGTRAAPPR
jgi:hypothetical protein